MRNEFMKLNLQRFAEGGATGEGAPSGQVQSGEAQVVYGKQPVESVQNTPSSPPEGENSAGKDNNTQKEAKPTFEELIKGEYKGEFNKAIDGVIGRRLAQERAKTQGATDIVNKLMARHGVNSIEELNKVLDSDSVYEEIASKTGDNPQTLRELEKLRGIANNYNRFMQATEAERQANEQLLGWQREAEGMKELYPGFDLNAELENPQFRALISTKNPQYQISMEQAYKLIHHDELMKNAEKAAAEKLAKSVNARAARPDENGLGNQSGVTVKNDVSKLTKKDRAEIARRAARGERIEF